MYIELLRSNVTGDMVFNKIFHFVGVLEMGDKPIWIMFLWEEENRKDTFDLRKIHEKCGGKQLSVSNEQIQSFLIMDLSSPKCLEISSVLFFRISPTYSQMWSLSKFVSFPWFSFSIDQFPNFCCDSQIMLFLTLEFFE